MDRPVLGLEVRKDVVREELYDVNEHVRRSDSVLGDDRVRERDFTLSRDPSR